MTSKKKVKLSNDHFQSISLSTEHFLLLTLNLTHTNVSFCQS